MTSEELVHFIHHEIPICAAMGIQVECVSLDKFVLSFALDPNRNVHGSVFAGSLYSLASVTGWSFLRLFVDKKLTASTQEIPELWLAEAQMTYLKPARSSVKAIVQSDCAALITFWERFKKKGKAKCALGIELIKGESADRLAKFEGVYACLSCDI